MIQHESTLQDSPNIRSSSTKKLTFQDSENLEDTEEATLLYSLKDEKLSVDVDNQFVDDPKTKEMASFVQKLTKARVESLDDVEKEEDCDVVEYYWKPGSQTVEPKRKSIDEELLSSELSDLPTSTAIENIPGDSMTSELNRLNVKKDIFNVKHFNSPNFDKEGSPDTMTPEETLQMELRAKNRSQSVSMGVLKRQRSKIIAGRRDSMAEMFILPQTTEEEPVMDDHTLALLENEAYAYQQMWGLDKPVEMESIQKRRNSRSQSISMGVLTRQPSKVLKPGRRDSIADLLVIPKTVVQPIDEHTLTVLENEALEYQRIWGLDTPDEMEKIHERTKKGRSASISMGVLTRQPLIARGRRDSLADDFIIPAGALEPIDENTLTVLEKEAVEYQKTWGLNTIDEMESIHKRSKNRSQSISMGVFHRQRSKLFKPRGRRESVAEQLIIPRTSITEIDEHTMTLLENEAFAYQQMWGIETQKEASPIIETDDEDDAEVAATLSNIPEVHIEFDGPSPPDPIAACQPRIVRPATPAEYGDWMQRFGEQASPDITMEPGRKTPATLETYLERMRSPSPIPRALTPIEHLTNPPSMEDYLEEMQNKPPKLNISKAEEEELRPVTPEQYGDWMHRFPEQLSPDVSVDSNPRSPSFETIRDRSPFTRALTPIETVQSPPNLETYLQRMRSKSPAPPPSK